MSSDRQGAQIDLSSVDLTDPSWFHDGPPHTLFARMRAEAPIRWNQFADGSGMWSLTRRADIAAVSKDFATFSTAEKGIFLKPDQVMPLEVLRNLLLFKDPPDHTKYRLILQTAFTPNTVTKLEAGIRARVTRVIDRVIEGGVCDFVSDIAVPIPLGVLCDLLGFPEEDIPRLLAWTDKLEEAIHSPETAAATDTFLAMAGFLNEQIALQTERGDQDSLVMRLRQADIDGDSLTDAEILLFFAVLVFAGNDTTRNTTATGMLALLEHPDQLEHLREDPSRVPAAVEELLRWTTVVNYFVRTATVDTVVAGQPIAAGDRLLLWYTSASRDGDAVADSDRLDIGREAPGHQAFGGGGRHFCLGAGLARLELRIIFEEVVGRMPDIELAGEPKRLHSSWATGLTSLPVRFTPAARQSG